MSNSYIVFLIAVLVIYLTLVTYLIYGIKKEEEGGS
jgi:hypothetical protein